MGKKNIVWNDYISQNERFADFFNGVVFEGEEIVCPEALTTLDSKLWRRNRENNSYHEYVRDNVKLWHYNGMKYILGLEPEESPHFALPVKYMNYESVQYDKQYQKVRKRHRKRNDLRSPEYLSGFSGSDRLMPVITIGVYLGEEKWSGFTKLGKMADFRAMPAEIRDRLLPLCNEFHVNLLDVHEMAACDMFRTDLKEVFGFLKHRNDKEGLSRYVKGNENFRHLQEDAYDVLSVYSRSKQLEIQKDEYETEEGFDMCRAIREMIEDGKAEGRIECLISQTIKKRDRGMSVEDIADALEEDEEMIKQIMAAIGKAECLETEQVYACMATLG
ncbi:MAG: hypothetical protein NC293_13380 [Roseburia sp.]|nr:hypothetical protein [Roseburia sp.]